MTQIFQDALENSLLSGVLKQAKQHIMIDQLLKAHLDKQLQPHCHVAQLQGDTLIVHVSSSIWLTKLSCNIPQLIQLLKETSPFLSGLKKIQCKIRPFDSDPSAIKKT